MSEETSSSNPPSAASGSKITVLPTSHSQGENLGGVDRELSELRKEVFEARNLIIKTDNLLKNLHAELKLSTRKQEQFERRHLLTSATAFIIFAVLAAVGAYTFARSEIAAVRQESSSNEGRAKGLAQELEQLRKTEASRRDTAEKATKIFEQLSSSKDMPTLNTAIIAAGRLDKAQLSPLEAKAIEEKEASLKQGIADAAHEKGRTAFRRGDFRTASTELARYVELIPNGPETPYAQYWLGEARSQTRDFAGAVPALEAFLKGSPSNKNHDWASVLLGVAYEEVGNYARAKEVYESAIAKFPRSIHLTQMRNRLRRIPAAQAAATARSGPVPPKP